MAFYLEPTLLVGDRRKISGQDCAYPLELRYREKVVFYIPAIGLEARERDEQL